MYFTWQSFSQALLVDSSLFSYIDVRHAKFLPPSLTTGEARDLSPRYTIVEDLALVRDESTKRVSQSRKAHNLVEGPDTSIQEAEPIAVKPVHSLEVEANLGEKMVTRHTLSIDRFLLGAYPTAQPQKTPTKDRTPPPPSSSRAKKKQCVSDPPKVPSDAPSKNPPRASGGIVIREPVDASRSTT